MNLPILIQKLYGEVTFTGLYSFEFVDNNRNTITEIFFMIPPKSKNVSESTRSSVIPTLGGNYLVDGGNSTKTITLNGELYFPYVGSPDNPVATHNYGLENTLNGLEELLKLRWMLIRYRDYTMKQKARVDVPLSAIGASSDLNSLYRKVSKKVQDRTGALYNEIRLIFHDYDMDDHFYCKVDTFASNQADTKYIASDYTITLECYEPDGIQKKSIVKTKETNNEAVDLINIAIKQESYETNLDAIQAEIGYDTNFINATQQIATLIDSIDTENENMQSGKSTILTNMPIYVSDLFANIQTCTDSFINTFLSVSQKTSYDSGDISIDDIVSRELMAFYNSLQKLKIHTENLDGVIKAAIKIEEMRYYSDSDSYTLTEDQFDDEYANKIENSSSFYYYTVMSGDTARIIAQRELNDHEQFLKILRLNGIEENDFIDDSLVGEKIKIPFPVNVSMRGDDNFVYESDYNDSDKFLFGEDIATNLNKELLISSTGDLLSKFGIENVYENIENRLKNNKGSLNVFHPNWGTISIDDGNAPQLVKIDRYITDSISQIQEDPRVESVKPNLNTIDWNGETITLSASVFFIGTDSQAEVTING